MSAEQSFIEQIHASGRPFVIAITGGGSGAISALLEVPGASATVLEAIVPYAAPALAEWLGGSPDHYCSERTARAMAMAALERAQRLSDADPHLLRGIGATASLATSRPKRGPHRIHVAWQSPDTTVVTSCQFPSNGGRAIEEQLATQLILQTVSEACEVELSAPPAPIGESNERREQHAPGDWTELLLGQRHYVSVSAARSNVLFPGAFNPLHHGHRRMAELAIERYGERVTFEVSIANVAKPPLDFVEIADRLSQFHDEPILLTRAATFVEKASIAPGCVFIVGLDTLERIGDPRFYGGNPALRDQAIDAIAAAGCRFLVFGRLVDSRFCGLAEIAVPPALRALCEEVPESEFREDVSSTELRS
jgi:nicotinamide mononucleotide (NMN) deamidase PncC